MHPQCWLGDGDGGVSDAIGLVAGGREGHKGKMMSLCVAFLSGAST